MITLLTALAPMLAKLFFMAAQSKKISKENARKFIAASQSMNALRAVSAKDSIDKGKKTVLDKIDKINQAKKETK